MYIYILMQIENVTQDDEVKRYDPNICINDSRRYHGERHFLSHE